jgi:carbon-monoxide dehydrogenase large subunit
VGQALGEDVAYDPDSGQLLAGSLLDYAAVRADVLPAIECHRTVTPTPANPLGAKGVGEAGAIAAPAAVANALADALRRLGAEPPDMPFTAARVWERLRTRAEVAV